MADMNSQTVHHIATLANIPVTDQEERSLADGFVTTLQVVDKLKTLDISHTEPTHQVNNLVNVFRDDVVDESRMFSQAQALANAAQSHDGFVVVKQILEQE
ncbi:MAG TPA: Asp-tRNA(Asn)/Glu-tRNA(Gln) amidotransferase subunit GatC [Patescibacteria group bacterium]|nr:Asp-tRNA(Asn)/Glu-tRNA(Gln) amidotransferase subunit GatC [Patescibacteria group bacterium]